MERYNLSFLVKNQSIVDTLTDKDIIDVDILENDPTYLWCSQSFINPAYDLAILKIKLREHATFLNCEIRQIHNIDKQFMDCLAFFPLK
jgi:hypothetical protein